MCKQIRLGKHFDIFHGSIIFSEGKKLIRSFHIYEKKNGLKIFRSRNSIVLIIKNWFRVPQCMKQQYCAYNRVTEGFQLWGYIVCPPPPLPLKRWEVNFDYLPWRVGNLKNQKKVWKYDVGAGLIKRGDELGLFLFNFFKVYHFCI